MQLLTLARNWRVASAAADATIELVRWTLPGFPVYYRLRADVLPAGTPSNASFDTNLHALGDGGGTMTVDSIGLVTCPVGKWVFWPLDSGIYTQNAIPASHGPWSLQLTYSRAGDSLTGEIRGRIELAYWQ